MSEWSYVIGAYGLTWAVMIGYLWYVRGLARRARDSFEIADRNLEKLP